MFATEIAASADAVYPNFASFRRCLSPYVREHGRLTQKVSSESGVTAQRSRNLAVAPRVSQDVAVLLKTGKPISPTSFRTWDRGFVLSFSREVTKGGCDGDGSGDVEGATGGSR
jgi:ribosomal protein S18